jgi:cytochrome oxidase Cu insertion factor (SCO1/SenC/PrrC family)
MAFRNYRTAAVLGVLVLLAMATLAGCSSSTDSGTGPGAAGPTASSTRSADMAPGFSGTTLEGTTVSLSQYLGKPVVLVFFASW